MSNYVLLTFSAVLLAANFSVTSLYQKSEGVSARAGFKFTALVGLVTSLVFWMINGFAIKLSAFSLILAASNAVLCMLYTVIGFRIMKKQGVALYTLFLMTGGMIVPYVWGLLALDEMFFVSRIIGLVFITGAVVLSKWKNEKGNFKDIMLCVTVFFINGLVSVISKIHSIETEMYTVSEMEFVIMANFSNFVISGICCLFAKKETSPKEKINAKIILPIIILSALFGGGSYLMQLISAKSLPATVLYPFVTGGSIIFTTVAERIIYKEKIKTELLISVVLCFLGTLLFL